MGTDLEMTPKAQITKVKTDKKDYTALKNFHTARDAINGVKKPRDKRKGLQSTHKVKG